eukprot:1401377-Pyramimonas_sp.AAC.1
MATAGSSVRFGETSVHRAVINWNAVELDLGLAQPEVPHLVDTAPVVRAPAEPIQQERGHRIALCCAQFKPRCRFRAAGR